MSTRIEKLREQAKLARKLATSLKHEDTSRILTILADEYEAEAEKIEKSARSARD